MRKAVGNSVVLAAICALVMLVIAQCMVTPALRILQSPDEVVPMATVYLRIIYCGIPVIMTYNMTSSILRALGDGQTPLYAMIVASLTNIALDMLFVLVFGWGVAGAAVATVIAQILASVYCILTIRKIEILKLERKDFSLDADMDKRLCILAAPMAFQNGFGVAFIAGFTATNKLYGVLEVAATSYGFAMTTYTGQNMGAGQTKRISQGIRAGLLIGIGTSIVITTVLMITGKWILGCFISVEEAGGTEAMEVAWEYLRYMIIFLPILYVLHVVRSCIQGMGNTVIPMVSGISEFCMRTGSAFLMPLLMGERGLMFAEIIAWAGADLILIPGYLHERKKLQ
jgi:Na+-driven multidrug efflux pump